MPRDWCSWARHIPKVRAKTRTPKSTSTCWTFPTKDPAITHHDSESDRSHPEFPCWSRIIRSPASSNPDPEVQESWTSIILALYYWLARIQSPRPHPALSPSVISVQHHHFPLSLRSFDAPTSYSPPYFDNGMDGLSGNRQVIPAPLRMCQVSSSGRVSSTDLCPSFCHDTST